MYYECTKDWFIRLWFWFLKAYMFMHILYTPHSVRWWFNKMIIITSCPLIKWTSRFSLPTLQLQRLGLWSDVSHSLCVAITQTGVKEKVKVVYRAIQFMYKMVNGLFLLLYLFSYLPSTHIFTLITNTLLHYQMKSAPTKCSLMCI